MDDAELMSASAVAGCTRICDSHAGERVSVAGRVRSVTVCPVAGLPQFEIEIYDGSGRMRIVWIGRRQIRGIAPGRHVEVTGRVMCGAGDPTIFNPEYRLSQVAASG